MKLLEILQGTPNLNASGKNQCIILSSAPRLKALEVLGDGFARVMQAAVAKVNMEMCSQY